MESLASGLGLAPGLAGAPLGANTTITRHLGPGVPLGSCQLLGLKMAGAPGKRACGLGVARMLMRAAGPAGP